MSEPLRYVKGAFRRQENVIGLLGFLSAGFLFNPGFFLLGGAVELIYLWVLASNPRFQKVVIAEESQVGAREKVDERTRLLAALLPADGQRFRALEIVRQRTVEAWRTRDPIAREMLQPNVDKMNRLLDSFLRASVALTAIRGHLASSPRGVLEKQAAAMEGDMKRETSAKVRAAKADSLTVLKRRVERLARLHEEEEVLRARLDTLDNAIQLIADQSVSLSDPEVVSENVDRMMRDMEETEKSIQNIESFISGGGEATPAPAPSSQQ